MQRNGIHTFLSAPSCSVSLTTSFQSHLFSWPPWTRHFLFSRHHSASSWGVTSLLRSQNPSHGKGAEYLRHIQSLPSRNTKLFASNQETARSNSTPAITWHTPHTHHPPRLPLEPEGVRLVKPHLFKWTFITLSWQFFLTADFQRLTLGNPPDFSFLFSKTECIHLEMTDEVNQLKREKRSIREWGREYLHMMWVVVFIASWVRSLCQQ